MLKEKPKRMTYAQAKLIDMIESRELKKWCINNNLNHSNIYKIAISESIPTYRIVCQLCHLIAPIEWLYYTDEQLPLETKCIPQFDYNKQCKFVIEHKYNYKELELDLSELTAYNIFTAYRSRPTLNLIRLACDKYQIDPVDFFIDGGDLPQPEETYPATGNIISYKENACLVISSKENNKKYSTFTYCPIVAKCEDGIELTGKIKGFVNTHKIMTAEIKNNVPGIIETVEQKKLNEIINAVKKYLL